jgi:spore maturation protein CgeB
MRFMSIRIKLFCHSIVSDWNHGNAHFLRGILTEFAMRGYDVESLEPEDSWSRTNLEQAHGPEFIGEFEARYPSIRWRTYNLQRDRVEDLIGDGDIALVHEWNTPEVVAEIGSYRRRNQNLRVFFHDTHHRAITASHEMKMNQLADYDAILVYGNALCDAYRKLGWAEGLYVWHEAADTRVFKPISRHPDREGLVWIGNWGDDERTRELEEFLIRPVEELKLMAKIYGVRYPDTALDRLRNAKIEYGGWLPNYHAPEVFSKYRVTVHVPRRPYVSALAGIPTIRPFEAMACCLPLICSPWEDAEGLFRRGEDYLLARNGEEMKRMLKEVLHDEKLAASLGQNGLATIQKRHTCGHRVDEFLRIYEQVAPAAHKSLVSGASEVASCA